jgi:hypothetical protein
MNPIFVTGWLNSRGIFLFVQGFDCVTGARESGRVFADDGDFLEQRTNQRREKNHGHGSNHGDGQDVFPVNVFEHTICGGKPDRIATAEWTRLDAAFGKAAGFVFQPNPLLTAEPKLKHLKPGQANRKDGTIERFSPSKPVHCPPKKACF